MIGLKAPVGELHHYFPSGLIPPGLRCELLGLDRGSLVAFDYEVACLRGVLCGLIAEPTYEG
jgi:hypothetical protein